MQGTGRGPREAGVAAAAVVLGFAIGYLAERALLRPRLTVPARRGEPLGSLAGERTTLAGPDGTEVTVETYGPVDAPPLVLAHGWVCTGRVWHEQVRALAGRYRVVTYDQPGHGRSSAPRSRRYDLDLLGDTFRTVVDEVVGPGPLTVAGHSLGGMTLLNVAGRHADLLARFRGVVLLSTTSRARAEKVTLGVGIGAAAQFEAAIRRIVPVLRTPRVTDLAGRLSASTDLSHVLTRAVAVGPDAHPAVVDFTEQLALDSGPDIVLGLAEAVFGVDEDRGLDRLRDERVPTTIVVGAVDRLTPRTLSRRMAARSGAQLLELPGVGHMAPLEAPGTVNEVLRRHLDDVVPGNVA